jgi:hypothetical protein
MSHTDPSRPTLRILLIEDNPGDAELVRKALSKAHESFDMQWVSRLADGLKHPDLSTFEVILADLSLPDSNGLDSVTAIRSRLPETPLVVLTSLANDAVAFQALDLGAQDYLVKDHVNADVLRRSTHYAIQRQLVVSENLKLLRHLQDSQRLLERKNRRLARLYKTAQQFVDNVSHEFRTPLTVIKEYAALMREGAAGDVNEEQQRMLNVLVDRADDLNTMVDDMLDVSRLEAGLLGAWRKNCRVIDLVRHVLPELERKAAVRGVSLETAVDENLPPIYCDDEKAGRVIINLVVNAIKFCRDPGVVRLWAEESRRPKEVVIGVTDNGVGIDERNRNTIFKRFKELRTDVRRSTKGFGLGLNIAKELVELNLGVMRLESKVGQGSTFSFTIPLADPVEVSERYLAQLAALHNESATVSVLMATVEDSVADSLCDEVDAFFHYTLLRRHDALFRVGERAWLYLLLASEFELEHYLDRAKQARVEANRNRPRRALPAVHFDIEGSWRVTESRHEIVACVRRYCLASEVVHA